MLTPGAVAMVAVVDTPVEAVAVDTSAADTLWPPPPRPDTSPPDTSRLDMLRSDPDNAHAYISRADIAAISGTAVGGITASAHAGGGLTFTASTFGCAIRAPQS